MLTVLLVCKVHRLNSRNDPPVQAFRSAFGIDLSPCFSYFRALGSLDLLAVDTSKLKNLEDDVEVLEIRNVLSSSAVGQAFSSEGTLFLGITRDFGIACWNRYRELSRDNI